jgi:hypothetical protein
VRQFIRSTFLMKFPNIIATITAIVCFFANQAQCATIVFGNANDDGDAAFGIRDANGVLVSGSGFQGAMGYFTISNSAISSSFAGNDLAAIGSAFAQFDPVGGSFALGADFPGFFQTSEIFDTRASVNSFGGRAIYAVLYKGTSIATASELLIAQLNAQFPTDPVIGFDPPVTVLLSPATVNNLVIGTSGGPSHDYSLGGGALPTFGLVAAVPEPTRAGLLVLGLMGACLRRRR